MVKRISKDDYYLEIAKVVSKRSTCLRRHYGAVIVNNDEIIATGYNGSPRGCANCCDVFSECPRKNAEHNSGNYGDCPAVHAEQNALLSAARKDMQGAVIYLNGEEVVDVKDGEMVFKPIEEILPCPICERMLKNSGITRIVTPSDKYEN